ncbi:MAG: flagellar hook-associated protein FlgK [Candidatus Marinimicrobia bacterium]|nr:flagellar hook-associated protein FlgK [Candidatus Neomarinimicrobiota bacterium]
MSISTIMGTSRIALSAYQSAIETTARNISNVGNENYVRRRSDIGALISPNSGLAFREQDSTDRLESGFIQRQLWYKNQFMGRYESDEIVYSQIESLFNEPGNSGLSNIMTEFWNAWSDLANDPESNTARAIVKDRGVLLSNTFNQLDIDLNNMQREVGYDVEATVNQVNRLLHEIKSINETMGATYSYDLADSRDAAITELSKIINIEVAEDSDHIISITTGGNVLVPLVNNDFINELNVTIAPFTDYYTVDVSFSEGGTLSAITGGTLGSLLEAHNAKIPSYLREIDALAVSIAEEVNEVHRTGFNLDNDTDQNFFKTNIGGADSLTVSTNIIDDPLLIATSSFADEAGNGQIAADISNLQNGYLLQGVKYSDYYNSMLSEVGSKVQEAKFLRTSQEMVVTALQNQRDSISGVSLDEEMTNLVKYEQAYQAASRMIAVADELIQSVLALI